jgi:hypothetical protein
VSLKRKLVEEPAEQAVSSDTIVSASKVNSDDLMTNEAMGTTLPSNLNAISSAIQLVNQSSSLQNQQQQQQIVAFLQDNKLILKAIDLNANTFMTGSNNQFQPLMHQSNTSANNNNVVINLTDTSTNFHPTQDQQQLTTYFNQNLQPQIQQQHQASTIMQPGFNNQNINNQQVAASFKLVHLDSASPSLVKPTPPLLNSDTNNMILLNTAGCVSTVSSQTVNQQQSPIILLNGLNMTGACGGNGSTPMPYFPTSTLIANNDHLSSSVATPAQQQQSYVLHIDDSGATTIEPQQLGLSNVIVNAGGPTMTNVKNPTTTTTTTTTGQTFASMDATQAKNVREAVLLAFKDTGSSSPCSNINGMINISCSSIESNSYLTGLFAKGFLSLLCESRLLEHVNMLIEHAVLFAKNVPYFMNIHEADRINLLKSSVFEIICVRHSSCFLINNSSASVNGRSGRGGRDRGENAAGLSSSLATLAACALATWPVKSGSAEAAVEEEEAINDNDDEEDANCDRFVLPHFNVWTSCKWLCKRVPQLSRFFALWFDFYYYFNRMSLCDSELAFFSAYLLFNAGKYHI